MLVYDRIAEGKYDNPLPVPDGTGFREIHICKKGKTLYKGATCLEAVNKAMGTEFAEKPFRAFVQEAEGLGCTVEMIYDENAFLAAEKLHKETTQKLQKLFEEDLYIAFDVKDSPKREKAFKLAWNYGQDGGLHEVCDHFAELVELIR